MPNYKDPNYLFQSFIVENKSVQQIADECGTTVAAVSWQLYVNGIKRNGNKLSRAKLEELYVNTDNSINKVAEILGTNSALVSRYLDMYGIEKVTKPSTKYDDSRDAEWIDLYVNKRMSAAQIALMYNTSHRVVLDHLRRNGIQTRSMQVAQRYANGNYSLHPDLFNPEVMIRLHHGYHYHIAVIADLYRCDIRIVQQNFNKMGIKIYNQRNILEAPPVINGAIDHGFETSLSMRARAYCVSAINPIILDRDNYCCRVCGSYENLEVHHHILSFPQIIFTVVDMNPHLSITENIAELYELVKIDPLFNDQDNMVTLCSNCHHKIHTHFKSVYQQPTYD